MAKESTEITKSKKKWLWKWDEPESVLKVIPGSKTTRLAEQAKLANLDAERSVSRAYKVEIARTKVIGEAMFKSGKALRYSFASSGRQFLLRLEAARRKFEPGYKTSD